MDDDVSQCAYSEPPDTAGAFIFSGIFVALWSKQYGMNSAIVKPFVGGYCADTVAAGDYSTGYEDVAARYDGNWSETGHFARRGDAVPSGAGLNVFTFRLRQRVGA